MIPTLPLDLPHGRRRRVLVVDDEHAHRRAIADMLAPRYDVIEAADGPGAIEKALSGNVDAIIMDTQMPGMSGCEAARAIRDGLGPELLPILLIAGGEDDAVIAAGLGAGGDDLITKPIRPPLLQSKLDAVLRFGDLFQQLKRQTNELGYFREHARRDYVVAERVFDSMLQRGCLYLPSVQYCAMPMERFNGDMVMAAPVAPSRIRVLLGDFAGHGLAAAVGALPISDIFYATAEKAIPLEAALREMNTKIWSTLPRNMFLSAVLLELDVAQGRCLVWNGGIPDAFILNRNGSVRARIESRRPPLGILSPEEIDSSFETLQVEEGERLFIATDGVTEASNPEGEFYGSERLEAVLASTPDAPFSTPAVTTSLGIFRRGSEQRDDITFIEVSNEPRLARAIGRLVGTISGGPPRQQTILSMRLDAPALQQEDPLGSAQVMLEMHADLREHRTFIFTVLTELFGNAVEHGLLRLDSSLKDMPNGFERYYEMRRAALERLTTGHVTYTIELHDSREGREAVIRVEDSGCGFSLPPPKPKDEPEDLLSPRGRGLMLVKGLCRKLDVLDGGHVVEATLTLEGPPPDNGAISGTYNVVRLPTPRI